MGSVNRSRCSWRLFSALSCCFWTSTRRPWTPRTAEQVLSLTRQLVEEMRLTTLMVTHNMKHAIEMGDRLIMMHQGRIVLDLEGEKKRNLTIQELMNEFAALKVGEMADDKMLLGY